MVLVEAGENDLVNGADPIAAATRAARIIDTVQQVAPGATVLVAALPPSRNAGLNNATFTFNAQLKTTVLARKSAGQYVDWVDEGNLTTNDTIDNSSDPAVELTPYGYTKIGNNFTLAAETAADNGWLNTPPSFNYSQCPNPPPSPSPPPPPTGGNDPPAGADPLPPFTPGETRVRRPDPSAISINGTYYSVESDEPTQPAHESIWLREASSLAGLADAVPSVIFTDQAGLGQLWAPEIMFIDGQFYVYFTMQGDHRMYVISSHYADRYYTAAQELRLLGDLFAIDGTTFSYNNQRYFVWSGAEDTAGAVHDVFLVKMSDPETPIGDRYLISRPTEPWELAARHPDINEGPEGIKEPNGQLHVVYSANFSTDQYCLGDLRLRAGGDPTNVADWHKSNGCLFGSHQETMEIGWNSIHYAQGPGHHTFALENGDINKSPTGSPSAFIYEAVPNGLGYKWPDRVRYIGSYDWWPNIPYYTDYTDQGTSDVGYSLGFFEDPAAPAQPASPPPPLPIPAPPPGAPGTSPGQTGIRNADPTVIRVNGTYISVESNNTALFVRQASSPQGLSQATPVQVWLDNRPSLSVWAPEIQLIDGTFYVYFSEASTLQDHRMYVIHSTSSNSGYSAAAELMLPDDKYAIDGTTFVFGS